MRIYINQLGYTPDAPKTAVLASEYETDTDYILQILNERKVCILETAAVKRGFDEASGDWIWHADFTELRAAGHYFARVISTKNEISGAVMSCCFRIDSNIYQDLLPALCRTYYYQRCGMELEEAFAGRFCRKSCHQERAVTLDGYTALESGNTGIEFHDVSGGWHDAGDYGRYTTAAATALAHILYA